MGSRTGIRYRLHRGDALEAYGRWATPTTIISDGAYGVRGFHGDTTGPETLGDWYAPHIEAWSKAASPASTLWFWNTEVGWATVHPLLVASGWEYVQLVTWDKGLAHIAGNVNGRTIRSFPVVTEVCAFYQRRPTGPDGETPMKEWLRTEWRRAGLRLNLANEVCGVANAATRKYLTQDWLWYWPPGEMFEKLALYANEHGSNTGWPYFSLDGETVPNGQAVGSDALSVDPPAWRDQCVAEATATRRRASQGNPSPRRTPRLQAKSPVGRASEPEAP